MYECVYTPKKNDVQRLPTALWKHTMRGECARMRTPCILVFSAAAAATGHCPFSLFALFLTRAPRVVVIRERVEKGLSHCENLLKAVPAL